MVLSRDPLFAGRYHSPAFDLHPDGNRVIVGQMNVAAQQADSAPERFIVVTNWFEELRQPSPHSFTAWASCRGTASRL